MTLAERDLFSALCVSTPDSASDDRSAPAVLRASRVDVGWAAWRASRPPAQPSLRQRFAFRLARWQHFGQAQFLVQVDDSYHTATSIRVRHEPGSGDMEILLIQTASLWQCLRGRLHRRAGRADPPWRKRVSGRSLLISRYPAGQVTASLPAVDALGYAPCPEALIDGRHARPLPLLIRCTD